MEKGEIFGFALELVKQIHLLNLSEDETKELITLIEQFSKSKVTYLETASDKSL